MEEVDFEKEEESVSANEHNKVVRKLREKEAEERELRKKLEEYESSKKESEEEEYEEDDSEESKLEKLVTKVLEQKIAPLEKKLTTQDVSDRKSKRERFFKAHPEYVSDKDKWEKLQEELENFNPNMDYAEQLKKAHRIVSGEVGVTEAERIAREQAAEMAGASEGSKKADTKDKNPHEDYFNSTLKGVFAPKK